MPWLADKVAEGDADINKQADGEGLFGSDPVGQPAKQKCKGDANKLNHQQGTDQVNLADANFRPVDGGHLDNGADAVIVEPESHQEKKQVAVAGDFTEGFCQGG